MEKGEVETAEQTQQAASENVAEENGQTQGGSVNIGASDEDDVD